MDLNQDLPHSARMYDYFLGGKDNYESDRNHAQQVEKVFPSVRLAARHNRGFMHRAIRHLAHARVRQFLDIGTGIPTEPNLHQIAQQIQPDARILYVDNDPIVLVHARALMTSSTEGCTAYLHADITRPEQILTAPALRDTLWPPSEPVAISLIALLHFVPDEGNPYDIVATLLDAVPSGSYLVISHATPDFDPDTFNKIQNIYRAADIPCQFRSHDEITGFFTGLDILEPGLVPLPRWRPDLIAVDDPDDNTFTALDAKVGCYAAVARKP
ncbi:SAM-dependent methyltransferase [Nocardia wallacei]|uniref:SAM-dependent methyltransferase n=1 Tax=Nocardia wallacei TaxID=480035 RepID=UPI0024542D36|nr:SAM-dependent methyltransferase [Nocardia wallacei]